MSDDETVDMTLAVALFVVIVIGALW